MRNRYAPVHSTMSYKITSNVTSSSMDQIIFKMHNNNSNNNNNNNNNNNSNNNNNGNNNITIYT